MPLSATAQSVSGRHGLAALQSSFANRRHGSAALQYSFANNSPVQQHCSAVLQTTPRFSSIAVQFCKQPPGSAALQCSFANNPPVQQHHTAALRQTDALAQQHYRTVCKPTPWFSDIYNSMEIFTTRLTLVRSHKFCRRDITPARSQRAFVHACVVVAAAAVVCLFCF